MPVLSHFFQQRALAEAEHIAVLARLLLATPGVVGVGDAGDVLVGEFAVGAVHQRPELAGVYEEHLTAAVAALTPSPSRGRGETALVASEEPQARGNLRRVEELARQRDHAVHDVASIRLLQISPSPDWLDDIEPLESTKPATPIGAK